MLFIYVFYISIIQIFSANLRDKNITSIKNLIDSENTDLNYAQAIKVAENLGSTILDFIPYIGNAKCLIEFISGYDPVTREKLNIPERLLSDVCGIPFFNYFKTSKNLKYGKKFFQAGKRAKNAGKLKNAFKFFKASSRQFNKAKKIQNMIKNGAKIGKNLLKYLNI